MLNKVNLEPPQETGACDFCLRVMLNKVNLELDYSR